jgi:hypothetical protein
MDVRSDTRRRWVAVLAMVTVLFAISGIAAYAGSASEVATTSLLARQAPQAAPTLTPGISADAGDLAEPAIVDDTAAQPMATVATVVTAPASQATVMKVVAPQAANLIANGDFEVGFVEGIGIGWERFATGSVQAGWQADTWEAVVFDGEHAQLLVLKDATQNDRYVGIFQTVTVAPDTDYVLTLRGLVRSDEGSISASNYGYRLQYGIDYAGGGDWQSSDIQWIELPWDEQPRTVPPVGGYRLDSYAATVKSQGPKLTVFIRGWKKWVGAAEGNYDINSVSLILASAMPATGTPIPSSPAATALPGTSGAEPTPVPHMPQTGSPIPIVGNSALALASVLLVVLLVAGVFWKLSRRRA